MISHGIGFVFFLFSSPFLIYKAATSGNENYVFGSVVFCISLLMVYTSSTLYHSVYRLRTKQRLRTLDHISIYFLIAGSYTPFLLVFVRTERGDLVLTILWAMVIIGSAFKLFFTHKFKAISTLAYVSMGAMALLVMEPLQSNLPEISFIFLKAGLLLYFIGVPFYLWIRLRYNHLVWHIFVLAASICHFIGVWKMI